MNKRIFYLFFLLPLVSFCQDSTVHPPYPSGTFYPPGSGSINYSSRKLLVGGLSAGIYGGSFVLLNSAWYKGYDRTGFHTFNDIGEWQQVDKLGHAWTAYQISRVTSRIWQWAGSKEQSAIVLGASTGLAYLLAIEYLDGRSTEWGWSWGDAGADILGAGLFAAQQLIWNDQKISLKFSSYRKAYPRGELLSRANDLFGKTLPERLLKDYNAQSYWLSFHIKSIAPSINLPQWLNLAVGYGAEGMYGGYANKSENSQGVTTFYRPDIIRYRQWYLSPDIDLTKIKTRSKFLRSAFSVLNIIKIPAPALELARGKLKAKWLK